MLPHITNPCDLPRLVLSGVIIVKKLMYRWEVLKANRIQYSVKADAQIQKRRYHFTSDFLVFVRITAGTGYEAADDWAALVAVV